MEKMENAKIRCWNKTHQKWNGDWRCEKHLTEWEMVSECCRMEPWTQLQIQDQHSSWRRWEDDINEFLKLEKIETENPTESNNQLKKNHGSMQHEDSGRWTPLENDDTMTAEERYESNARARRNTQSRPASCVNGVRLSDDEVANITWNKSKRRSKSTEKVTLFFVGDISSSANSILRVEKLWAHASARVKRSRTHWWIDDQELRDGLNRMKVQEERIFSGSSCDWAWPVTTKTEAESV